MPLSAKNAWLRGLKSEHETPPAIAVEHSISTKALARQMNRDQRGRACCVNRDAGALQVQVISGPGRQNRQRIAHGGKTVANAIPVVVRLRAEENADALPFKLRGAVAGVLDCLPCLLEKQPLLRIHTLRFPSEMWKNSESKQSKSSSRPPNLPSVESLPQRPGGMAETLSLPAARFFHNSWALRAPAKRHDSPITAMAPEAPSSFAGRPLMTVPLSSGRSGLKTGCELDLPLNEDFAGTTASRCAARVCSVGKLYRSVGRSSIPNRSLSSAAPAERRRIDSVFPKRTVRNDLRRRNSQGCGDDVSGLGIRWPRRGSGRFRSRE